MVVHYYEDRLVLCPSYRITVLVRWLYIIMKTGWCYVPAIESVLVRWLYIIMKTGWSYVPAIESLYCLGGCTYYEDGLVLYPSYRITVLFRWLYIIMKTGQCYV